MTSILQSNTSNEKEEMMMLKIGCHLSISKGFKAIGNEALRINANTFQFFTRNPRGSKAKAIDPRDAEALMVLMKEHQFAPILAHAPYTLNPCSPEQKTREFAALVMADDLVRMEYLPNNLYNFHPGSHGGQGVAEGIRQIILQLNNLLKSDQTTIVLLETMSGKGTEVGSTFEELRQILDGVILTEKVGVCLDTCHINDAGYDIVHDLEGVLNNFDKVIGLGRLYAIHLNDSLNPKGSRKDRHAKIGEGSISLQGITQIINHPKLRHLPFFLETPNDNEGYAQEIALLRNAYAEEREIFA